MADTEDTQKYGFDTVPVWKTVRRERWSGETMGKRKSESDKGDMGEDNVISPFKLCFYSIIYPSKNYLNLQA